MNTFTIKADVIFHAADHDDLEPSVLGGGEDVTPRLESLDVSEPGIAGRSWESPESVGLNKAGSLRLRCLGIGEDLEHGSSSDSGFQDQVQTLHFKLKKQDGSSSKIKVESDFNGTLTDGTSRNLRMVSTGETAMSSHDPEVLRSPSIISNLSSISQDSISDSKDTKMLEQALGNLLGEAQVTDSSQFKPIHGHEPLKHTGNGGPGAFRIGENPDLVIEVGGQKIRVHKSVLAEKSDYFKARLSREILKVKGVSHKTLCVLLDYVYTYKMNVTKDNVVDVVTGAKVLQMPCAVQAAVDAMSDQLTTQNCYEILSIAKKQRLSQLKVAAYRFMSDNFLQVLRDPAVYGRLSGSERDLVLRNRMEGCECLMAAEINDVFDRVGSRPPSRGNSRPQSPLSVASFEDSHMIYYYNQSTEDWRTLTAMPDDINTKGCSICTMYNYLFVAGGIRGYGEKGKASDKVFSYNPITDRWSEIRPMNQARSQLKLVSMDGFLYAIGGECLFTVEKYDPRMDRWTNVAPLPKGAFAVAHEATTCNGELYVSGGTLFYRLLKYDPRRDEWQECPYNNSRRKSTDMVALKSFIYRFDVNREQGVKVFKYNTIVKMWHECASYGQGGPLPFRCTVVAGRIYCVNKAQTLQFVVGDDGAQFTEEPLRAPMEAKGVLFPFVLILSDRGDRTV